MVPLRDTKDGAETSEIKIVEAIFLVTVCATSLALLLCRMLRTHAE